ncbi:MAG TPA: hypothetical protein VNS19_03645 [Acidimicrobiales bacterium]|nr:hypothetical protein [Acidimicrobiales bacterium]
MAKDEKPQAGDGDAPAEAPSTATTRWGRADEGVRATAKWLITTATAFTGIVFASGGFIVKGNLGESYFWQRALAMWLGAAAAALGLAAIIGAMAATLAGKEPRLDDLPPELAADIAAHPANFLPADSTDLEGFRDRYAEWHVVERQTAADATRTRAASDEATAALTAAEAADPAPADLEEIRKRAAEAQAEADRAEADATTAAGNMEVYRQAYLEIIDRAKYITSHGSFTKSRAWLIAGGLAVVLGATTYTIAISYTPPESKPATPPPEQATLVQRAGPGGEALWAAAQLDSCETAAGRVPVLLSGGDGSVDDPWAVATLPTDTCDAVSFTAISEVATVVVPEGTVEITYEAATTSTTTPFPTTSTTTTP